MKLRSVTLRRDLPLPLDLDLTRCQLELRDGVVWATRPDGDVLLFGPGAWEMASVEVTMLDVPRPGPDACIICGKPRSSERSRTCSKSCAATWRHRRRRVK